MPRTLKWFNKRSLLPYWYKNEIFNQNVLLELNHKFLALPHWALTICLQFTASTDCKRKVFYLIPTQIYLERTRREPEALLKNPGQLRRGLPPRTASVLLEVTGFQGKNGLSWSERGRSGLADEKSEWRSPIERSPMRSPERALDSLVPRYQMAGLGHSAFFL